MSSVDLSVVTDTCERMLAEPSEAAGAVEFQQAHVRRKFRAIIIAFELMYDQHASEQFRHDSERPRISTFAWSPLRWSAHVFLQSLS